MSELKETTEQDTNVQLYHLNEFSYDIEKERNRTDVLHFLLSCLTASNYKEGTMGISEQHMEAVFQDKDAVAIKKKIIQLISKIE